MSHLTWLTARPVAHRGYHDRDAGRIENSMSAIKAAVDRRFAIEVDLQIAEDGVPMVFHDSTLDRLTSETGSVRSWASTRLQSVQLNGSDDKIPTFDALLEEVNGLVPLVIELKPHGTLTEPLARSVLEKLKHYSGPTALMSFDPSMVATLKREATDHPRGIIANATPAPVPWGGDSAFGRFSLRHLMHIPGTRPDFIAYDCRALPAPGPALWSNLFDLPVLSWTVRSQQEADRIQKSVSQIIFEGFDPESTPDRIG